MILKPDLQSGVSPPVAIPARPCLTPIVGGTSRHMVALDGVRGVAILTDRCPFLETIEHVENPRGLVRELIRLARPGGLVLITTTNQSSLLSKLGHWVLANGGVTS